MAIGNKQIGWSQESNLLWEISKQLDRLNSQMCTGPCPITITTSTTTSNPCPNCVEAPVIIGTQTWTRCNLNVSTYRNGDLIPEVTDPTAWAGLTTGAWCYYDNDPANGAIYGKLYNWYAVNDPRGLAPLGQHIPTNTEFTTLTTFLGGESVAGGKLKETELCHWDTPNTDATNESGFTGLPGGLLLYVGIFNYIGSNGFWWSSSENNTSTAWFFTMNYDDSNAFIYGNFKTSGFSVRCIID